MIIGLVTLLSILFSGGPEDIFLIPKADKKIKSVIVDKERQKQAVELFKQTGKKIIAGEKREFSHNPSQKAAHP